MLVANRYRVENTRASKLGSGAFGEVVQGRDTQSGQAVAVKLEPLQAKHPQVEHEARIYQVIEDGLGVPTVHHVEQTGLYTVMVMDCLGKSLEDLFSLCKRKFSVKTVLMIADQVLQRVEYLHSRGFLHRDIKPDNFLIGRNGRAHYIYLIDLGLAKRFKDSRSDEHIPYREDKQLTGTARYASLWTHQGVEQSRRDDLECLGYMLLYLLRGSLPW